MKDGMHSLSSTVQPPNEWKLKRAGMIQAIFLVCIVIGFGAVFFGIQGADDGPRRLMHAYLVGFAYCLSLSLGSLFFLIIQHLSRAGWSVAVRRPAEILAGNLVVVAVMFIPIAWSVASGESVLYSWARTDSVEHAPVVLGEHLPSHESPAADAVIHPHELGPEKKFMLQPTFFLARWVAYFVIWIGLGLFFCMNSLRQDRDRAASRTNRMEQMAAPAAVLFGLSVTWGAFDLLMSLNPDWQSTMFGVYFFAGSVVGALSLITLTTVWLRQSKQLPNEVGTEHFMDFGRLMFGFVFFWGYIAFSQYMLLWYANIPVELTWFQARGANTAAGQGNSWSWLLLFLLFGHFLLPFAGLMSRHIKKRPQLLAMWAVWLLIVHFLDLVWIVLPELGPQIRFGLIEIGTPLILIGIYLTSALAFGGLHSLIPSGDPRLGESLHHESAY